MPAYVEVKDSWTRKSFLEAVAIEIGIRPGRTLAESAELVGEELARSQRLLLVDEADIPRGQERARKSSARSI